MTMLPKFIVRLMHKDAVNGCVWMKRKSCPRWPKQFEQRVARIRDHAVNDSPMLRITPIIVSEFEQALHAYYGGLWRTAWALTWKALYLTWGDAKSRVMMWICDRMGWTKVYWYPQTDEIIGHWERHGRKCSGSPNCANMNCISDSVPKWFKVVTRYFKDM